MKENNTPTTEQKEHASMLFTDFSKKIQNFYAKYNPSNCTPQKFVEVMAKMTDHISVDISLAVLFHHITDEQGKFIAQQMDNLNIFLFTRMKTEYPEIFHDELGTTQFGEWGEEE